MTRTTGPIKKVKRGRPVSVNKLVYTSFRLTKDEKYEIYRRSRAMGMKPSVYMRHILNLLPETTVEELSEAAIQIREIHRVITRLGNNFNQAVRAFHQSKEEAPDSALRLLKSSIKVLEMDVVSASRRLHKEVY
ncbi:MAG: hypothetical protein M0024_10550 [Nitrospiraceae bacterium]|nr:hypothetical protein [Nitrospiraceae bacterium]